MPEPKPSIRRFARRFRGAQARWACRYGIITAGKTALLFSAASGRPHAGKRHAALVTPDPPGCGRVPPRARRGIRFGGFLIWYNNRRENGFAVFSRQWAATCRKTACCACYARTQTGSPPVCPPHRGARGPSGSHCGLMRSPACNDKPGRPSERWKTMFRPAPD